MKRRDASLNDSKMRLDLHIFKTALDEQALTVPLCIVSCYY
ncbi:MAG TPA: hypothetical protein VGC89_00060 [Pyrinomonadaceae bacterium]